MLPLPVCRDFAVTLDWVSVGATFEVTFEGLVGFDGGEVVVVDCGTGAVSVDGVDAASRVDVASDYFWLEPGSVQMYSTGTSSVSVAYTEKLL